ncbi:SDR family NAD(P)-dependent oxidoreductase [Alphaproteobacteria bacterium KMM 3653]|uniref:SDR family NAD(P)-dependent oxidoreductase n=1 Tax=Harenicola maris TaxID=2841044 RepID=A0AAP2CPU9_9RHOB|nr:SDR family NAD(P)-dependent oxidoreductase [Harenicola maris]
MQNTLLIGASGGIGRALTAALTQRGGTVTPLSRSENALDLTDEDSIKSALEPLTGPYDAVILATGALEINGAAPEKSLSHLSAPALMDQFALNAIGPALVLKHARRLLPRDRRSVFAALSARVGSIGDNRLGGWYSYRAAKAALNQLIHTGAIELARTHPQALCICLHPGTVATDFTRKYQSTHPTVPPQEAAENLLRVMDGLTPQDTGGFYDWAGKPIPW